MKCSDECTLNLPKANGWTYDHDGTPTGWAHRRRTGKPPRGWSVNRCRRNRPTALSGHTENMLFVICDIQRDPRNDSGPRAAACAFAPPRAVHHLQASFSTSDGKSSWWAALIFN